MIADDIPAGDRLGTFARLQALVQRKRELATEQKCYDRQVQRGRATPEQHQANLARSFQLQVIDDELQQLAEK